MDIVSRPQLPIGLRQCSAVLACALVLLVSCESAVEPSIDPAPEHLPPNIPLNAEVFGEALDGPNDVDEFTLFATDDGVYDVFLQSAEAVRVDVLRDSQVVASTGNQPQDTSLFASHTGLIQVGLAAPYVIRVTADPSDSGAVGPYRLFVYAVDHRPEHIDSTIATGDTISGEQIEVDRPLDVDEFRFNAAAGDEFNLFFQAQSGAPGTLLVADVEDANGVPLAQATSLGSDSSLSQVSGRFAIRTTGWQRVRVLAAYPGTPGNVGAYRFFLYRVNRQPETRPNTLAFGDSLSGEMIELPGDVDEFRVNVLNTSAANVVVQQDSTAPGRSLLASLINPTNQVVAAALTLGPGSFGQSGRVQLAAGNYVLRVDGNGEVPPLVSPFQLLRGPYRLWLYRFQLSPEVASGTLMIPDTIVGESLDPPGDEDVYRFNGTRGEHINIALHGMADSTPNGGFRAFLMLNGSIPVAFVNVPTSSPILGAQTTRLDLPTTAPYTISVTGASSPEQLFERGPYRLAVTHVPTTPEQVSTTLMPGDSVTTELIDTPGDWDQFTIADTVGEELGLIFGTSPDQYPNYPSIVAYNPLSGDSLAGTVGQARRFTGPFRVPSGGQVSVAVFERPWVPGLRECYDSTCGGVYRFTGAYQFSVIRVNRAPETVSASYTIGDTVRGEAIMPTGDLDEFTATGVGGEPLSVYLRLTAPPVGEPDHGLTLEIIDPATGAILVGQGFQIFGPSFVFEGSFTVPPNGLFLIRVRGTGTFGEDITTAPYEFFLKR